MSVEGSLTLDIGEFSVKTGMKLWIKAKSEVDMIDDKIQ